MQDYDFIKLIEYLIKVLKKKNCGGRRIFKKRDAQWKIITPFSNFLENLPITMAGKISHIFRKQALKINYPSCLFKRKIVAHWSSLFRLSKSE